MRRKRALGRRRRLPERFAAGGFEHATPREDERCYSR